MVLFSEKPTDFTGKREAGRIRQDKAKVVFCDTFEIILCFSKLSGEGNSKWDVLVDTLQIWLVVFLTSRVNFFNKKPF